MIVFGVSFFLSLLASYFILGHYQLHEYDLSFYSGAILALINVAALYFSWKKILEKKNLVLSGSVIVIKYPLLGFILYEVVHLKQISLGWFLIGMGTFIPAAVVTGIWWSITSPKMTDEELNLSVESFEKTESFDESEKINKESKSE